MKAFKFILCAILIVAIGAGAFFIVKAVSEPSEAEKYAMLNGHMVSIANNEVNTLTLDKEIIEYSLPEKGEEVLVDRKWLADTNAENVGTIVPPDPEKRFANITGQIEKTHIGYDLATGEGYIENYKKKETIGRCNDSAAVLEKIGPVDESNLINAKYNVKSNDKVINYVRPKNAVVGTDTYGEYVGIDDAVKYNEELVKNLEIINIIKENSTLDKYGENIIELCETLVNEYHNYGIVLNVNNCNITNEIVTKDKNYVLKSNISLKDTLEIFTDNDVEDDESTRSKMWLGISIEINIEFNKTQVVGCSFLINFDEKYRIPFTLFKNTDDDSVGYTTMLYWYDGIVEYNLNFNYGLNSEKVKSENYQNYDNEIEQRYVYINYYANGGLMASDKLASGDDFVVRYFKDEEYLGDWYLDEEYTKPITSVNITKIPSNDLNLYCKIIGSNALLIFTYIDSETEVELSSETLVFDERLMPNTINGFEWGLHYTPAGYECKSASLDQVSIIEYTAYRVVILCDAISE